MNLPATVDVALGLVVLYLLLSTVCSILVELVATWKGWRRQMLQETINRLLAGSRTAPATGHATVKAFWDHTLVQPLVPSGREAPSYLTPGAFAAVILDIGLPKDIDGRMPDTTGAIQRALVGDSPHPELRNQLLRLSHVGELLGTCATDPGGGLARLQSAVATWYNEAMERLTGQYKRRAQQWLFWIGLAAAMLLNADSIRLAYILGTNDSLRQAVATYAVTLSTNNAAFDAGAATPNAIPDLSSTNAPSASAEPNATAALRHELATQIRQLQQLQAIGFPVGWQFSWATDFAPVPARHVTSEAGAGGAFLGWVVLALLVKLSGLAVTGLAVSLGAPFWYDILNKLVSLRGSGARPSTSSRPGAGAASDAGAVTAAANAAVLPAAATIAPLPATAPTGPATPLEIGTDLARPEIAFSLRKSYWLAEASLLAYERDFGVVRRQVQQGWFFQDVRPYDDHRCTQAILITGPRLAVLAFRGTEPKEIADWLTDAKFPPKPWDAGFGQVHEGFAGALEGVYASILADVKSLPGTGRLLYITGHSLGAALATLMSARLASQRVYPVQGVYTFGSPRVGDAAFAETYTRLLGDRTFRFVNNEDLVTRVPPRSLEFKHVGSMAYLDADGHLHHDIGFWYRFLNLVANAVEDFKKEAQTTVQDHSMELYRKRLKDLAAPRPPA